MGFTFIPPDYEDFVTIDPLDIVTVTPYITIRKREGTMNIRKVLAGDRIRTRSSRHEMGKVVVLEDNYWNRRWRGGYTPAGYERTSVRTIDIEEVLVAVVNGEEVWEKVELTKAQQKQLAYQRHLEYVTSPESETYWCS